MYITSKCTKIHMSEPSCLRCEKKTTEFARALFLLFDTGFGAIRRGTGKPNVFSERAQDPYEP